jgi:hypothetical protein
MRTLTSLTWRGCIVVTLASALAGCGDIKQSNQRVEDGKTRSEAKRQKAACASSLAYDRLKGLLFDQAISRHKRARGNLDALADYSFARMENPVVKSWDPALDITRCAGRFVLTVPPGAEHGFAGERRLQADIDYTAQAAADGSGFVYQAQGAEPIVARLAAFNLSSGAYQPSPAIDDQQTRPGTLEPHAAASPAAPEAGSSLDVNRTRVVAEQSGALSTRQMSSLSRGLTLATEETGEATVRAFYAALGAGNGVSAAARIVPEKRSSGAFSPEAISRFYGKLPEPIRLTGLTSLGRDTYRVSYRYSAGRSHCTGSAVVNLTSLGGRYFIRSISALNGC